jgi:hypothetical protein
MKITIETNENTLNEFEKQLHEQYAINNNAILRSVIVLACALIVVIGYFGFVFVNSTAEFSNGFFRLRNDDGGFFMDVLLCSYVASSFILFVLARLCIYQGIAQRKEQFITYAIRTKYKMVDGGCEHDKSSKVLPNDYHPFGKNKIEVIQGLYGELLKVFKWVFYLLSIGIIVKVCSNMVEYDSFYLLGFAECMVCIILVVFLRVALNCYHNKQMYSYIKRQKEYNEINPKENLKSFFIDRTFESSLKGKQLQKTIKLYCDCLEQEKKKKTNND